MRQIRNLDEANQVLSDCVLAGNAKGTYALERMQALMSFLDNPQEKFKVIHVAGTSGKTSTCYYAASLLKVTGAKIGLTVSPHVSGVNERLQIDLIPLAVSKFCHELSEFLELIDSSGIKPTYFELLVALAYWEFARQEVDYAVIEVGLGGLLDGTNVISRPDKVCIITDIGLDHVNVLGHSLPEITAQKAGIIQDKNAVFSYDQAPEITKVLQEHSQAKQAMLHLIGAKALPPDLAFLPLFQQHNFVLAQEAVSYVLQRDGIAPLTEQQLLQAANVHIPARMEMFKYKDKTIILDGAHNAQKLHALARSVKEKFPDKKIAVLASFVDGRGYRLESSIEELRHLTDKLIITAFNGGQDLPYGAIKPEVLADQASHYDFATIETVPSPTEAFAKLLRQPEPILLVAGSFFIMNEVRPLAQKL